MDFISKIITLLCVAFVLYAMFWIAKEPKP